MYSGYEMPRNRYLFNWCDGGSLHGWAAAGTAHGHHATHLELFSTPDTPGLLPLESALQTVPGIGALATDGLCALDIYPFLREEQVAEGAVAIGAAARRQREGLVNDRGISSCDINLCVHGSYFLLGGGVGQNKKAARVLNPAASGEIFSERTSSEPHWATG